jgi:hypothetical protein
MSAGYHEFEGLHELELEGEGELELEGEGEFEAEQFFGKLAALAKKAAASPALRRIGAQAARAALGALREGEGELEGELELEMEAGRDNLYSPYRKVYVDALMEHMGHRAAEAESEAEAAEAFLPLIPMLASNLLPLAMKAAPMLGRAAGQLASKVGPKLFGGLMKAAPKLTQGISNIARTLHRNPQTRQLLRAVPQIARRTTADLAKRAARGQSITPQSATQALARQTARTLSSPQALARGYQRGRRLDRRAHALGGAGGQAAPGANGASAGASACPTCGR